LVLIISRDLMNAKHLLWFSLPLLLLSCTESKQPDSGTKLLNYGYFTIQVPQSWKRVDVKGIDSYVGEIHIDSNTIISFDLGWHSNSLSEGRSTTYYNIESGEIYTPDSSIKQDLRYPTHWKYYGKADSVTLEKLKRNRTTWLNVDEYRAKLITPKNIGSGTTGIYIDSLWKEGDNNDKFQINGQDLTSTQQQQLITAIKTLKFYQHPSQ
jgi:hypothetical protein